MHPPGADVVVVRHGEIGTKSEHVSAKMERRLRENLRAVLADRSVDAEIEQRRFRLRLHTDDPEGATAAAADTFGVVSASPAVRVDPTLDSIRDALADAARESYDGGAFAVSARRAGVESAHPFSSTDIEREGGSAVWDAAEAAGVAPEVDLDDPDLTFFVDCREDDALVFLEKRTGPGGLPLGTQDPVVALLSGGIDSPVAAWELMKRGAPVVPVYVDLGEYGGVDHQARALSTAETLARYAPDRDMRLRIAPAGDAVAERTAAAAAQRIEAVVPSQANASVERRVTLPETIRGREYRIRVENRTLVLDHPHDGIGARQRLVLPPSVARVEGNWTGGDATVAVRGGPNGSVVTLREDRG